MQHDFCNQSEATFSRQASTTSGVPGRQGSNGMSYARLGNSLKAYIIEDSQSLSMLYAQMLKKLDFETRVFDNGSEGLAAIQDHAPDLLLLDLQLPDIHGFQILEELQEMNAQFPRIVVTAHGSVDSAVDAMQRGASDFLEKPFTAERLQTTVDNVIDTVRLRNEVQLIREQIVRDGYAGFVGKSLPMQVVYRIIDSAATSRASVFITGESGTGKELCAQAIHEKSNRSDMPFVAINCGAIPRELFESEIFGHVKGAFSGASADRIGAAEQADGGTLFLDEIGEMDLDLQVKLLRFIQTGTIQRVGSNKTINVNVRFVCATNKDPIELVGTGKFREDLYYRLNVIPINIPSLREREDDPLQIAKYFLSSLSSEEGKNFVAFDSEVEDMILSYDWPGNVRQLHNVVHNTVLLNNAQIVEKSMLPLPLADMTLQGSGGLKPSVKKPQAEASLNSDTDTGYTLEPLWKTEQNAIKRAIEHFDGNIPVAAAHLGVSASTIYRKIKSWEAETQ